MRARKALPRRASPFGAAYRARISRLFTALMFAVVGAQTNAQTTVPPLAPAQTSTGNTASIVSELPAAPRASAASTPAVSAAPVIQADARYGLGTSLSDARIKPWNIDVAPDGDNLPSGSGQVLAGRALYAAQCASCHGARGEGGLGDALAGGQGTLASAKPLRTVGSYWPYATTLYDYIRRAMPLNAPQSLTDDEVYAVTGYVLHLNGLADESATFDRAALLGIVMPNVDGFVDDPRPDLGTHARRP